MPVPVGIIADEYNKPAVGGFNPAALTGIVGWYDATDASTFTFTTGSQFSQWRDKSPNARHLTAEYDHVNLTRSGSINGLTAVLANHTGVEMTCRITGFNILNLFNAAGTDCMNFIVCKMNNLTTSSYGMGMMGATYRVSNAVSISSAGYLDIGAVPAGRLGYTHTMATGIPYMICFYRSGANIVVRVNGAQMGSMSSASGAVASETGIFKLLAGVNYGHLGEAIHIARYDATDFINTENYLAGKWGITAQSPSQLPGLKAWYDADDASSFTYSSSTVVSQWNDKSGNNKHLSQATVSLQPNRNATQNGKSCIAFDGTNDYLYVANVFPTGTWDTNYPVTVLFVAKFSPVPINNGAQNSPFGFGNGRVFKTGGGNIAMYITGSVVDSGVPWSTTSVILMKAAGNATSTISVDASTPVAGNAGTGGHTDLWMGEYSSGEYWPGTICEFIVIAGLISDFNRISMLSYLKSKWGTP